MSAKCLTKFLRQKVNGQRLCGCLQVSLGSGMAGYGGSDTTYVGQGWFCNNQGLWVNITRMKILEKLNLIINLINYD